MRSTIPVRKFTAQICEAENLKYAFVTHAKSGSFGVGYEIYYSGAQIYCPDM
jgi:hypothetical protein